MSEITTVGLDLAKNVLQLPGRTHPDGLCFGASCGGGRCLKFWPGCRPAW